MDSLHPIFENDWIAYEWTEVSEIGKPERVFIRGKHRTPPPVDGYHYERRDSVSDPTYLWERVYESGGEQ